MKTIALFVLLVSSMAAAQSFEPAARQLADSTHVISELTQVSDMKVNSCQYVGASTGPSYCWFWICKPRGYSSYNFDMASMSCNCCN
ncbi:MAG TPA: hypothetical protein VF412_16780 [Bdellovibrio sp.]|uniref:hypothetical protein n=1 Tax=Bdellovibrio sp. TaxID=28201 RepID=UPI002EF855CB